MRVLSENGYVAEVYLTKNNKEYKERNHKWNFDAARRKHGGLGLSQELQVL